MKSIFKSIMPVAIVAMAFASCSKDATADDSALEPAGTRSITVVADIAATRTVLSDDRNHLQWSAGEVFGVFSDNAADRNLASSGYAAGKEFTIGGLSAEATKIYAYYPKNDLNDDEKYGASGAHLSIEPLQTQSQTGVLDGRFYPMTAVGEIADDKVTMLFEPWACALALNIYGGSADEKVVQVKFTSDVASSGSVENADLTADDLGYAASETTTVLNLAAAARFAPASGKPADSQLFADQAYLVVAKSNYPAAKIEVLTAGPAGEQTYTFATTHPIDCSACDFYPLNLDLSKAQTEPADPNRYGLTFTPGTTGHEKTTVYLQDGIYRMVFEPGGGHGEHFTLTDPLLRGLSVGENQNVELVFKYKMSLNGYDKWQFTTFFAPPYYNNSTVDCQTMKIADADDPEGWVTYRHDLTQAVAATQWGGDVEKSQIRFRFRMVRTNEVTNPQCPELYGFEDIYIKDAYIEVSDKEPEPVAPDPVESGEIAVSFKKDRPLYDFESRFNAVGVLFDYDAAENSYHFTLDESGSHAQHVVFSDLLNTPIAAAALAAKSVELVFEYKAEVDGSVDNATKGEWYNKWFFKVVPVIDAMTSGEYNNAAPASASSAAAVNTDDLKFGTADAPMEWTEYRMYLNPSFASQTILNGWGSDLSKHPQLRLDFRARNTTNNDCPYKSLGLTDIYVKNLRIEINDK